MIVILRSSMEFFYNIYIHSVLDTKRKEAEVQSKIVVEMDFQL